MHSFEYTTAKKYIGKKAIVVGAATSGHDVSHDLASHGVGKWKDTYFLLSTYLILCLVQVL